MRTESELVPKSRRVVPGRLLALTSSLRGIALPPLENLLAARVGPGIRPTVWTDLHAEGTAATASRLHIRVVEFEARAFHGFDVVDFHAVKIQKAGLVDEHTQAVVLVGLVEHILLV